MVAIFTGAGAGFERGSASVLGGVGLLGNASQGRGGEGVYVNAATGNLMLQKQDEVLVGGAFTASVGRTYNSLTTLPDDNNDEWRQSTDRRVVYVDSTTVKRISGDGSEITYTWNAGANCFVATAGGGAYDTITGGHTTGWSWTDGDTGTIETYWATNDATKAGKIKSVLSVNSGAVSQAFAYDGTGRLTTITNNDGSWIGYTYQGSTNNITEVHSHFLDFNNGNAATAITRTRYTYDASNRLQTVVVDLTPNNTADSVTYVTTYGYDASNRVNSITQSDGSSMAITYDGSGRVQYLDQTAVSGVIRRTELTYSATYTDIKDPAGQTTRLEYDASGNLKKITAPPAYSGAAQQVVEFTYNANGDVLTVKDALLGTTTYAAFTVDGRATSITDRTGAVTTRSYGSVNLSTGATGAVTLNGVLAGNVRNELLSETTSGVGTAGSAVSQVARYVYGANGLRYAISAEGRVTEYVRNSIGKVTTTIEYVEALYTTAGTPTEATMTTWVGGLGSRPWVQRTEYSYDARYQLTKVKTFGQAGSTGGAPADPTIDGYGEINYVYDQAGQLLKSYATGQNQTTYVYDGMGRVTAMTDANGGTTTFVFTDTSGSVTTVTTTASGYVTTKTYNKAGDLLSVTDSGTNTTGGTTTYDYDKLGRVRVRTDAAGLKTYTVYDNAGRHVGDVDHAGYLTEYRYDANNRLVGTIQYHNAINAAYLGAGATDPSKLVNPNNTLTIANLRPSTHAEDTASWTIYDGEGRVIQTILGDGSTTISTYDASGRLQKTTSYFNKVASGTVAGFVTTAPTALVSVTADAAKDAVARNFYDKDGLLIGTLDGEGYLVKNTYDSGGQLVATTAYATVTLQANRASGSFNTLLSNVGTSSLDRTTRYVYDGRGLLRFTVNALNQVSRHDYDVAGLETSRTVYAAAMSATADYTYDNVKSLTASLVSNTANRRSYSVYDAAGRLAYAIDAVNAAGEAVSHAVVGYAYDNRGQVTRQVAYAANYTGSAFDKASIDAWSASNIANSSNRITRSWYTARGEAAFVVDAENYVSKRDYDAKGQLVTLTTWPNAIAQPSDGTTFAQVATAAAGAGTPVTRSWQYDSLGRVTREIDGKGIATDYTYHGTTDLVNLTTVAANSAPETVSDYTAYDGAGRANFHRRAQGATESVYSTNTFDGRGNVSFANDDRFLTTHYTYDLNGRVKTVTDAAAGVTQYEYNAFGEVWKVTDPKGNVTYSWYDKLGRVTTQRDGENYLTTTAYTVLGEVQNVKRWATATSGTATMTNEPAGSGTVATTSFTYDRLGRVRSSVDALNQTELYTYTVFGDRATLTNRLGGVTKYGYDRLGRLTREQTVAASTNWQATGNYSGGNLVAGSTTAGSYNVVTHTYDGFGNRKQSIEGFSTSDGGSVTALRTTGYAYDANGQVTTVTHDAVTTVQDNMVTVQTETPTETFQYDARGNVIRSVDAAGAATHSYYDKLDRKIREIRQVATNVWVYSAHSYDGNGNLTSTKVYEGNPYPSGTPPVGGNPPSAPAGLYRQTDFGYDNLDRLTTTTVVSNTGNTITSGSSSGLSYIRQNVVATASGQVASLSTGAEHWVQVTAGTRLSIDVGVETTGVVTAAQLAVHFVDANGGYVTGVNVSALYGNQAFNSRAAGFVTVPAGAVKMRVEVYAHTSGAGSGSFSLIQPMVALATVGQTHFPDFVAFFPQNMVQNAGFSGTEEWGVAHDPNNICNGAFFGGAAAWSGATGHLTVTNQYDANGNVVKVIDANGNVTWNWYDKLNRKTAQLDAAGFLTAWTYNAEGAVLSETRYATRFTGTPSLSAAPTVASNGADRKTIYTYNLNGNRVSEKRTGVAAWNVDAGTGALSAAGTDALITYTYNALGQVVTKTQAGVQTAYYTYDNAGRLSQEQRAAFYDANGTLVTPTTSYQYDALGGLVTRTQAGSSGTYGAAARTTTYRYGEGGRLLSTTDAEGYVHAYYYDKAGRLKKDAYARLINADTSAASGAETTVAEAQTKTYDLGGRVLTQSIYSAQTGSFQRVAFTSYQYNAFDQVIAQGQGTDSASGMNSGNARFQITNQYDAAGRLVATNSGDGVWKFFGYDKAGNQTAAITSAGASFSSGTGFSGALGQVGNANVNGTFTVYDKRNMAVQVVEEGRDLSASVGGRTLSTFRGYNAFGEVAAETNAAGATVTYSYNTLGRMIRSESPAVEITAENGASYWVRPSEDYYYDLGGRLVATRDANGSYGTSGTGPGSAASKSANTGNLTTYALLAGTGYDGDQALTSVEFHADGGRKQTLYDVMGDARLIRDELYNSNTPLMHEEERFYNRLGHIYELRHNRASNVPGNSTRLVDNYATDQFGQRIKRASSQFGFGAMEKTNYDALGRVVSQTDFSNYVTTTAYAWDGTLATSGLGTFGGWVETTTYANGRTAISKTDNFEREVFKQDLGGHQFGSTFDVAGRQLTRGNLNYTWYNTGLVATSAVVSGTVGSSEWNRKITTYGYDAVGNRTSEQFVNDGSGTTYYYSQYFSYPYVSAYSYQYVNETATYDALGRMTSMTEAGSAYTPAATIAHKYDAAGNVRRTISTHHTLDQNGTASSGTVTDDHWFRYDSMNRLVVDKGVLSGAAGAGGTTIVRGSADAGWMVGRDYVYDHLGQRTAAMHSNYNPGSLDHYNNYNPGWYWETREIYEYDGAGHVVSISETHGAIAAETGSYGGVNITPPSSIPAAAVSNGTPRSTFVYDLMGRMWSQSDYDTDGVTGVYGRTASFANNGQLIYEDVSTKRFESNGSTNIYRTVSTYALTDASTSEYLLGAVGSVSAANYKNGAYQNTSSTVNTYQWWDGAMQGGISYTNQGTTHTTSFTYDAQGTLVWATIYDGRPRTVTYRTNGDGQVIRRDESDNNGSLGDPHEVWYRFNGRELGYVGNNGTSRLTTRLSIQDRRAHQGTGAFRNGATFGTGYSDFAQSSAPINAYAQGSAAGGYVVQRTGETLRSVAQQMWGDASLWYQLAEANGLQADTTLVEGQRLSVPAGVVKNKHNAATFRPYDANDALGNVSPTTPKPPKKNKCGVFGQILLAVVAIAVTIVALPTGTAPTIVQGALAGLAGGAASQTLGVATGIQSKFDFKGIALSAIGGGMTPGLDKLGAFAKLGIAGKSAGALAAQGALSSAVTQGIGVATGLQSKFSWAGIAAGAVGSLAGDTLASALGKSGGFFATNFGSKLAYASASLLANAGTRSVLEGTSFGDGIRAALPDVIGALVGQALGGAVDRAIAGRRSRLDIAGGAGNPVDVSGALGQELHLDLPSLADAMSSGGAHGAIAPAVSPNGVNERADASKLLTFRTKVDLNSLGGRLQTTGAELVNGRLVQTAGGAPSGYFEFINSIERDPRSIIIDQVYNAHGEFVARRYFDLATNAGLGEFSATLSDFSLTDGTRVTFKPLEVAGSDIVVAAPARGSRASLSYQSGNIAELQSLPFASGAIDDGPAHVGTVILQLGAAIESYRANPAPLNRQIAAIRNHGLTSEQGLTAALLVAGAIGGVKSTGPRALYRVGPYNEIKGMVPGADAHHVGQKAAMRRLIAGYDPETAPAIIVPTSGHTRRSLASGIVSRRAEGLSSARSVVARDIRELRRVYPDIPNARLQELISANKLAYPEAFRK